LNRQISKDARVFKGRLIYAANMIGAFWLGLGGFIALLAFFIWRRLQTGQAFQKDDALYAVLLATGIIGILVLVPGKLLATWPYAVVLEPQKGIWVCAPPVKLWIPLGELVDINTYSGAYGGGHVIELSRSHGLVKQLYINSLFFPDESLAHELRVAIDRRDGVVHSGKV
jgi:hypothetical protein